MKTISSIFIKAFLFADGVVNLHNYHASAVLAVESAKCRVRASGVPVPVLRLCSAYAPLMDALRTRLLLIILYQGKQASTPEDSLVLPMQRPLINRFS